MEQTIIKHIRYHTKSKKRAFWLLNEKNKIAEKNIWRVAAKVKNRIIFDVDKDKDIQNVKDVKEFYEKIFKTEFKIIKTINGYHVISENKYTIFKEWEYNICRVIYPLLQKDEVENYIIAIINWYDKQTHGNIPVEFQKSGLDFHYGNFDIIFAINVIRKGYYCIRISKKSLNDFPIKMVT